MNSDSHPVIGHKIGMQPTPAVPYIRFSDPKQEKGSSLERQNATVYGMIDRWSWAAQAPVQDFGKSAFKGDHIRVGNLGKWAESVRRGEVAPGTILVVEKIDRLSREGDDVLEPWLKEMIGLGVRVAIAEENRIYDESNLKELGDRVTRLVRAEAAQAYVENMRVNVIGGIRKAQRRRLETGKPDSDVHPKWLAFDAAGDLKPIPERADTIRTIYEWAAKGMGVATIVQRLNQGCYPCWTAKAWMPTGVRHLLRHESVDGSFQQMEFGEPFGDRMPNYYPGVVDNDLIAKARAQLGRRKRLNGKPSPEKFVNVFSGLTRCDKCGGRMHVQKSHDSKSGRTYRFFRCYNAAHRAGCNRNITYRYADLESAVLDRILHLAMDDRFFSRPDSTKGLAITVADLERGLALDREKSTRLLSMMISTAVPDPVMVQMRDQLTTAIAANETALERTRAELKAAQGWVDPAVHLARVRDVRVAMSDPDPLTALAARDTVATAIQGVISNVLFERDDITDHNGDVVPGPKTITVIVAGGIAALKFDNGGRLIDEFDLSGHPEIVASTVTPDPMWASNLVSMVKRASRPSEPGPLSRVWASA